MTMTFLVAAALLRLFLLVLLLLLLLLVLMNVVVVVSVVAIEVPAQLGQPEAAVASLATKPTSRTSCHIAHEHGAQL